MDSRAALLFLLSCFCFSGQNVASAEVLLPNPCHGPNIKSTSSVCEQVTIPTEFCAACSLGSITDDGRYMDCTKTIDTENPQCWDRAQRYLDLNPCDQPRHEAYNDWLFSPDPSVRERGRQIWDFFIYSVCEQACDCMPLEASESVPAVEIRRGNCQVHAYYDICRVLPDIKLIRGEASSTPVDQDLSAHLAVCPDLVSWWKSDDSAGWKTREDHYVADHVWEFLERVVEAAELTSNAKVWKSCHALETKQKRIKEIDSGWRTLDTDGNPVGRHEACFVWHNGKGYLIGGRSGESNQHDVDEFDPETLEWTSHHGTGLNIHHAQCVSLNGKIWFPGAWTGNFPAERNWETMPVYDPETRIWNLEDYRNLPENRRRGSGATVVYDGKIYHSHGNSGGHTVEAQLKSFFDVYDPATNEWTPQPDPPNARDHTGGGLINHGGEDLFCVAGGRESAGYSPDFFGQYILPTDCFSFRTGEWSVLPDIPSPRAGANYGTTCDGKLMVAGGEVFEPAALNATEVFDGEEWSERKPLIEGRHGSSIIFDCRYCGEAYVASGNPTRGGGIDLVTTERLDTGVCERSLSPTNSPSSMATVSTDTNQPSPTPIAPNRYINCGGVGGTIFDGFGRAWEADNQYSASSTYLSPSTKVIDTPAQNMVEVYRRTRWAKDFFSYEFNGMAPGKYKVSLHFAEMWNQALKPNKRNFHVDLQGERVLTDYDIFVVAKGGYRVVIEEFEVSLTETDTIKVDFLKGRNNSPSINAISLEMEQRKEVERYSVNVSCGGNETVTDGMNRTWITDEGLYSRSRVFFPSFGANVTNTDTTGMDPIYKSQRWDPVLLPYTIIGLRNAYYRLTMHFVEQRARLSAPGLHQFNIDVQGDRRITNFDVFERAGARHRVNRQVFYAKVVEGNLNFELSRGAANDPIISAFQLEEMPPEFVPPL